MLRVADMRQRCVRRRKGDALSIVKALGGVKDVDAWINANLRTSTSEGAAT